VGRHHHTFRGNQRRQRREKKGEKKKWLDNHPNPTDPKRRKNLRIKGLIDSKAEKEVREKTRSSQIQRKA